MKADSLWKISVAISAEAEEAVVELLAAIFGLTPLVYSDAETGETFVIVYPPKRGDWSPARRAEIVAGLKRIASCDLDLGPGKITARTIRREDWAESWKRHFQPMEIDRLLVKPS